VISASGSSTGALVFVSLPKPLNLRPSAAKKPPALGGSSVAFFSGEAAACSCSCFCFCSLSSFSCCPSDFLGAGDSVADAASFYASSIFGLVDDPNPENFDVMALKMPCGFSAFALAFASSSSCFFFCSLSSLSC